MIMGGYRKAALFGFILFLLVVSLAEFNFKTRDVVTVSSTKSVEFLKKKEIEKRGLHHLYFFSKRRVPNGPDPIHNRYDQLFYIFNNLFAAQNKLKSSNFETNFGLKIPLFFVFQESRDN